MENEEKKEKDKGKSRIPPRRGQIKEKIFADLLKQLKIAAAGLGRKRENGNKSSASTTTPDQSSYTSDANSDI